MRFSKEWIEVFHKRKGLFSVFVFYLITLYIVYNLALSRLYSYSQTVYTPNYLKLILSVFLCIITFIFVPKDSKKPSTYLYYIYYLITYLPTVMFYWMADKPTDYIVYETICFVLISLIVKPTFLTIRIKAEHGLLIIYSFFIIYVAFCVILVFRNGGIHINALIKDLYQLRSENNTSGVLGYILNWCAKSFMPFYFVYFFLKKNYGCVCLVSFLQMLLFFSYGFKAYIMAIFMIIAVGYLMRNSSAFLRNITISLSAGNIGATLLFFLGSTMLLNLFPYRTLFLPSQGQFEYYDFFTHNKFLYFSEGSIGKLFGMKYPYTQQIGRVVNAYIYGADKISNGNTGVLSYGYADLGVWGMILGAILIGIILNVVDSSTDKLPIMIPVSAMAYQMFMLNDNNILICLNTGGIIWTIVMLIMFNSVYSSLKFEYNSLIRWKSGVHYKFKL